MMKKALILGITGQDGSYLADILLSRGCEVHGMVRHTSHNNLKRIEHLVDRQVTGQLTLHHGDMLDPLSVDRIIRDVWPQEIYNEADQDNVDFSYHTPSHTWQITCGAVSNLLESIRTINPEIKLFQPVSATMFGLADWPQTEQSSFSPQSPYACAKLAAYYLCQHYRREHGLFVCTGIMYNHDSPRRSDKYLLHRIAKQAVQVARGKAIELTIPIAEMRVDIGFAGEYMNAAIRMLQQNKPDDYIVSSGVGHRIYDLACYALRMAGVDCDELPVVVDSKLQRPGKQPTLIGDCSWAKTKLGFNPNHDAKTMIAMLVQHAYETEKSCE